MWGDCSTALPYSHITQVTDGLEQDRGMAGTPGSPPRGQLCGEGQKKRCFPRNRRRALAKLPPCLPWERGAVAVHEAQCLPPWMPTLPLAAAVVGFGVGSVGLSGQIF